MLHSRYQKLKYSCFSHGQRSVTLNELHLYRRTIESMQRLRAGPPDQALHSASPSLSLTPQPSESLPATTTDGRGVVERSVEGDKRAHSFYSKNLVSLAKALIEVDRLRYMHNAEHIIRVSVPPPWSCFPPAVYLCQRCNERLVLRRFDTNSQKPEGSTIAVEGSWTSTS